MAKDDASTSFLHLSAKSPPLWRDVHLILRQQRKDEKTVQNVPMKFFLFEDETILRMIKCDLGNNNNLTFNRHKIYERKSYFEPSFSSLYLCHFIRSFSVNLIKSAAKERRRRREIKSPGCKITNSYRFYLRTTKTFIPFRKQPQGVMGAHNQTTKQQRQRQRKN